MAASYVYGLTHADVVAELPGIDAQNIGAAGGKITTGDITQWINDAAAKFNAMLDKSGIEGSATMDADAHDAIAAAVKAWAVEKCLLVLGITGEPLTSARETWHVVYAEYSNRPQQLGDAYADGYTVNIDSDDNSEDWSFIDSEGSLW